MTAEEAEKFGYTFLSRINKHYVLYGNGSRRLIVPSQPTTPETVGVLHSYVIIGNEIEPLPWEKIKSDHHSRNVPLEKRV